jgi:HSP90 family molecular chaperone
MFQCKAEKFSTRQNWGSSSQNIYTILYTNKRERFGTKINLISSQKTKFCLYINMVFRVLPISSGFPEEKYKQKTPTDLTMRVKPKIKL